MKYIRFRDSSGNEKYGLLEEEYAVEISADPFSDYEVSNKKHPLPEITILAPVVPSKVVALAYNYKDLIGEQDIYDEPLIFLKTGASVIGNNDHIILPESDKPAWTEVELAIVISRKCSNIPIEEAQNYILGYTIGNDVTIKNVSGRDHHLARSKACDTFCPLGPFIETDIDTSNLALRNTINGKLFQESNTANRILGDAEAVHLVSRFITLLPGDVILTGTPAGAEQSIIKDGDKVTVSIDHLSQLTNTVKDRRSTI